MAQTTITEALAELKTIAKRIEKKKEFVLTYLARVEAIKDPLEREGGSVQKVAAERQAIRDLQERTIAIRRAIQSANESNAISVNGDSRSIADWLVWRREVAPGQKELLEKIRAGVNHARGQAQKRGTRLVESSADAQAPEDVVINVSESELASQIEKMETVLGTLDGQLSLKNATVTVEV